MKKCWIYAPMGVVLLLWSTVSFGQSGFMYEHGLKISSFKELEYFELDFPQVKRAQNEQLWIINMFDLYRYDGIEFERFNVGADLGVSNLTRQFGQVHQANNGTIWIGTMGSGILRFDPISSQSQRLRIRPGAPIGPHILSIAEDPFGGIWFGTTYGIIRIKDQEALTYEYIQRRSPAYDLQVIVDELDTIASLTQIPSNQKVSKKFYLSDSTEVFLLGMGQWKRGDAWSEAQWGDSGWLTNADGDTLWQMDLTQSIQGGGLEFLTRGYMLLAPGQYTLHFSTDSNVAFDDWALPDNYMLPYPPAVPTWWGIQALKISPADKQKIEKIWQQYPLQDSLQLLSPHLYQEEDGSIWVYEQGLQKLIPLPNGRYAFEEYLTFDPTQGKTRFKHIHSVNRHSETQLWISAEDTLGKSIIGLLDKKDKSFQEIKTGLNQGFNQKDYQAGQYRLTALLQDHEGNLWIGGLRSQGLHRLSPPFINAKTTGQPHISTFQGPERKLLNGVRGSFKMITSLELDLNQNLWVSTWTDYLHKIDLQPAPIQIIKDPKIGSQKLNWQSVQMGPEGKLWLSQFYEDARQNKILVYDPKTSVVQPFSDSIQGSGEADYLRVIGFPSTEHVLLYGQEQFIEYNRLNGQEAYFPVNEGQTEISYLLNHKLLNDSILLVGYGDVGLFNFRKGKIAGNFNTYLYDIHGGVNNIKAPYFYQMMPDSTFWVGSRFEQMGHFQWTAEGLNLIEELPSIMSWWIRDITLVNKELPVIADHFLFAGIQDQNFAQAFSQTELLEYLHSRNYRLHGKDNDQLWIFTDKGTIIFDMASQSIRPIPQFEGIHFKPNNFYEHPNGSISIVDADQQAVYHFHPDSIQDDSIAPKTFFTQLSAQGEDSTQNLDLNWYALQDAYSFAHNQNSLTIRYKGLQFNNPKSVRYQYRLLGSSNENWIDAGTKREASFFDLAPGSYAFSVKAMNADGYWSKPIDLNISIRQPWWNSLLARIIYIILLAYGLYSLYRFQLSRQLAQSEAQRLSELDQIKSRLYTNITHEFRTPLTVIQGMARKVIEKPDKWLQQGSSMIERNTIQLLNLVNQMLDLSKLESGKISLQLVQTDIISFLYYIAEPFQAMAETIGISLHIHQDIHRLEMDLDPDRLTEVISNLLSNAIKFTPEGGQIDIHAQKDADTFMLIIRDTGIGISPDKLPHIFDRFYQADDSPTRSGEGTGIGLALTKELVQLMGGRIQVSSQSGKGTEFTLTLPIYQQAVLSDLPMKTQPMAGNGVIVSAITDILPESDAIPTGLPHVLLIEDNPDIIRYLTSCLEANYRISIARNGQEGIDKALEIVPDLIISDVMMPKKDGFEVCYTLKRDIRTSHVPIILLTAKADVDSRLTGLRRGADAYLSKPFNEEELLIRIHNLLEVRSTLQERYRSDPQQLADAPSPEIEKEDAFIQKLHQIVLSQLSNYQLDVPTLCKLLGMARTPLHNKLKALTGMSTTEFVRYVRLTHAQELLRDTDMHVSEIAYATGFQNHTYFSRKFRDLFGQTPKEWREENEASH